jgi:hypothetical protein
MTVNYFTAEFRVKKPDVCWELLPVYETQYFKNEDQDRVHEFFNVHARKLAHLKEAVVRWNYQHDSAAVFVSAEAA